MREKLLKINKIVGITVSVIILGMMVLELFPVSTLIIVILIDVVLSMIIGNVVIPIVTLKFENRKEDELNILLDLKGLRRNNLMLYSSLDALKLINHLQGSEQAIHGIDTFTLSEENIQPHMEYSPDYTNQNIEKSTYIQAKEDIERFSNINEAFVFEIVYEK